MAISVGYTASVTGSTAGLVAPAWPGGNTPYTGALLLMVVQSSRTASLTYFGYGNADPAGWNRFGSNLQAASTSRSCALFWRIAGTGGTTNDTPSIAGFSDSARTTSAGNTSATIMELRDGIVGTTCIGSWDLTNANGLGMSSGTMATWNVANTANTATTLTVATSSWSDAYAETGLLALAWHSGTLVSWTGMTTTVTGGGVFLGGIYPCSSGTSLSTTLTDTAASTRSLLGYVIGFNPATYPTQTLVAGARIQKAPASTLAAGAQIILNVSYPVVTLTAGARMQSTATSPLAAGARVQAKPVPTIAAGAQIAPVFTPKILMGTGNALAEALGSQYFALSSDIDGGDSTSNQANSPTAFVYVIDGGRSSD